MIAINPMNNPIDDDCLLASSVAVSDTHRNIIYLTSFSK